MRFCIDVWSETETTGLIDHALRQLKYYGLLCDNFELWELAGQRR